MQPKSVARSFDFTIFIAGDVQHAKQVCREFCFAVGLCVTVEPTTYIYTGGEEAGVRVGLINYPRFGVENPSALHETARQLGVLLMNRLCQNSYSIAGRDTTEWYSRRPE